MEASGGPELGMSGRDMQEYVRLGGEPGERRLEATGHGKRGFSPPGPVAYRSKFEKSCFHSTSSISNSEVATRRPQAGRLRGDPAASRFGDLRKRPGAAPRRKVTWGARGAMVRAAGPRSPEASDSTL